MIERRAQYLAAPNPARALDRGGRRRFLFGLIEGGEPQTPRSQQHGQGSGVYALWHFRLAGSCSLSVGGWAPSGAANPGRPVLADGWADFFLVFDVGGFGVGAMG
jgi:hypothetical protein